MSNPNENAEKSFDKKVEEAEKPSDLLFLIEEIDKKYEKSRDAVADKSVDIKRVFQKIREKIIGLRKKFANDQASLKLLDEIGAAVKDLQDDLKDLNKEFALESAPPAEVANSVPQNTNVLFLGEMHGSNAIAEYATQMLFSLKAQGFTTVAIEVDTGFQSLYDQYLLGTTTLEEIAKKCPLARFLDESRQLSPVGKAFFEEIKRLGLKIVCVEHDTEKFDKNGKTSAGKTRDDYMSDNIEKRLKAGEKIIYFVGAAHASINLNIMKPEEKVVSAAIGTDERSTAYLLKNKYRVHSVAFDDATERRPLPNAAPQRKNRSNYNRVVTMR